MWRPFHGERLGERSDAGFARTVGGNLVQCDDRRQRADVDYPAVAALDHVPPKDAARPKHPGEVRLHDRVPLGVADVERRTSDRAASRVDEDVDLAEGIDD